MTKSEEKQVKTIAKDLLATLHTIRFLLDWRKKQQSRAAVQLTIQEMLGQLPENVFDDKIYEDKCHLVYDYVYNLGEN